MRISTISDEQIGHLDLQENFIFGVEMQDHSSMLSEDDLALIHALQLHPRASWTTLGEALDIDPVTVARRWSRLSEKGKAWVSASPGPRMLDQICLAFVEIDCVAGAAADVARTLSLDPRTVTVERAVGNYDILATVATGDMSLMSRYALDSLPMLAGVTRVNARIATHVFTEGGRWRIDALDPTQRALLSAEPNNIVAGDGVREMSIEDYALYAHLNRDGRASSQALAASLGISPATVKRRIDRLTRLGLLRFRCDFARPLGGWLVSATFAVRVPPEVLPEVGQILVGLPETRNCAAVSGSHNLILEASLHSIADVHRFETAIAKTHPHVDIVDRTIMMRHDKLLGHLLDEQGRSVDVVPPDLWFDYEL